MRHAKFNFISSTVYYLFFPYQFTNILFWIVWAILDTFSRAWKGCIVWELQRGRQSLDALLPSCVIAENYLSVEAVNARLCPSMADTNLWLTHLFSLKVLLSRRNTMLKFGEPLQTAMKLFHGALVSLYLKTTFQCWILQWRPLTPPFSWTFDFVNENSRQNLSDGILHISAPPFTFDSLDPSIRFRYCL